MSLKSKKKEFHFSLGVLFRWLIFAAIVYFSINYLSQSKSTYNPDINLNIAGVSTEPIVKNATNTFEKYKSEALRFINNQLTDVKKQIITKVYEDIIKSIESSKK